MEPVDQLQLRQMVDGMSQQVRCSVTAEAEKLHLKHAVNAIFPALVPDVEWRRNQMPILNSQPSGHNPTRCGETWPILRGSPIDETDLVDMATAGLKRQSSLECDKQKGVQRTRISSGRRDSRTRVGKRTSQHNC